VLVMDSALVAHLIKVQQAAQVMDLLALKVL
jgi:hypothetical protein